MLVLAAGAVVWLVPWSGYLAYTLPDRYDTHEWRLAWVGFDIVLLFCFAACAWLGWRRRRLAGPFLIGTATLMFCDAWFDVLLDWGGPDTAVSILMAALIEVPLAAWLLLRARRLLLGDTGRWRTHPAEPRAPDPAEANPCPPDPQAGPADRNRYRSRSGAYLNETELARFYDEYRELALRYRLLHDRPGPGVRAMALRFSASPENPAFPENPADECDGPGRR